jgi:hypothetical protein
MADQGVSDVDLQSACETSKRGFGDLNGMIAYLEAQRTRIAAVVAEMSECQKAFTTALVAVQQKADDAQTASLAAIEAGLGSAAPWLAAELSKRLPEVTKAKTQRRAELQEQLKQLTDQRGEIEKQSADELGQLHKLNPVVNQREEELKAEEARQKGEIGKVDAQLNQARAGLGWLVRFGKIRELRELHHRWSTALYGTQARLMELRTQWQKQHDQTVDSESRLQKAWRFRTADIARCTEESQKLEDDFDGVCRREALTAILADLKEPQPTGISDADLAIRELLGLRVQIADATQGIGDSAELIGLMGGIASGLEKLQTSVESVKQEQDMHSELANLKLNTPPVVTQFHGIWDELLPIVKDSCMVAQHPKDFHATISAEIGGHLTDKQIEAMFVALGDELNRATKEQWG